MLQSLLIDRFQLRFHRETKEGPVFLLVSDGKAPKLNPPKEMDTFPWAGGIGGGLPEGPACAVKTSRCQSWPNA